MLHDPPVLLQNLGELVHLGDQRGILARRVLDHLAQLVLDRHAGHVGHGALRLLDTRDLELEEELGQLDGEAAAHGAHARLRRQVGVEPVLEQVEVVICQRRRRRKLLERKGERRLARRGEVDGREGHAARGHVRHAGDGLALQVARHRPGERAGQADRLRRQRLGADEEAGILAFGQQGG